MTTALAQPLADDLAGRIAWDLVSAVQAGDGKAFGQLYDRYHAVVFRFVLYRVGDRQVAEDLTSETFCRALHRIASVSYQGRDISAWFVTIARNLVLDRAKSSRHRLEQSTGEFAERQHPRTSGHEQQVLDHIAHAALWRTVALLPDDYSEVLFLRFVEGLNGDEVASRMGRDRSSIRSLQHRAVRRLAQLLPAGVR